MRIVEIIWTSRSRGCVGFHLTILKPTSFSQRSRNGAPCNTLTGAEAWLQ
jgi:hypothetical protein